MKLIGTDDTLKISKGVEHNIYEYFDMRELYAVQVFPCSFVYL